MKPQTIITCLVLLTGWMLPAQADDRLELALQQAARDADSFDDQDAAYKWLSRMSKRLRVQIPNPFYRTELLRIIHREATRSGLEPELVMAVIQVESSFDRFAVSDRGARGLMQLMPFWVKEIGHPHDNLFNPATNLHYGCIVLRNYLRQSNGNLDLALSRYHGSTALKFYAVKVKKVMRALLVG